MDLKEIQKHIDQAVNEQNNRPVPEFEGYSPFEMHQILNFTFGEYSPLQFQKLSDKDYSLILLSKYGQEKRLDSFYAEKYFKAFPRLLDSVRPGYGTLERYSTNCYSDRTFERFLDFFGLVNMDKQGKGIDSKMYITKADLFDRLIKCMPHKLRS